MPIEQQIVDILSDKKLYQYLNNRDIPSLLSNENITDVTSGMLYKELLRSRSFSNNDISLTWNTDGISVFNSSKYSIWPLQASINELPPHLRAKNILLIGLWFGEKPNMNTFLKPFVEECSRLQNEGFYFSNELQPRKVVPLIFCADAPARAMVRNAKQYNGMYGCDWCETPGVTEQVARGPSPRYYPLRTPVVMRDARSQARNAINSTPENPIKGIKGVTVVDCLPTFDLVRGTAADYMHSVCLGTTRGMVNLWVDSKHHDEDYYIGNHVGVIDERLQAIYPPSEIHRPPRSLSQRNYWKASEWRAFLLYSLVVLRGILPTTYLNHVCLWNLHFSW